VLVAHTCNPSYSGGRDQEDCCSKPAQANNSRPISKKGLVEWLKVYALSSTPTPKKIIITNLLLFFIFYVFLAFLRFHSSIDCCFYMIFLYNDLDLVWAAKTNSID
jgi:hypothetical protein